MKTGVVIVFLLIPSTFRAQGSGDDFTATKTALHMSIRGGTSQAGAPVAIWLRLEQAVDSIPPFGFILEYDESLLQLTGIDLSDGLLLNGVRTRMTKVSSGHHIAFLDGKRNIDQGVLCHLQFQTADPDSVSCGPLRPVQLQIDTSNFSLTIDSSAQCLFPREPAVRCSMIAPRGIEWSDSLQRYEPDSVRISFTVSNSGSREATDAMAQLLYDTTAFELLDPQQLLQPMIPDVVPVGGSATAVWYLRAKPRGSRDSLDICATASFANAQPRTCCARMNVPAKGTIQLDCDLQVPDIRFDSASGLYSPMPFIVTGTVYNPGSRAVLNARATLGRDPYTTILFSGADAPSNATKSVQPSTIPPGGSGTVQWELRQRLNQSAMTHRLGMEVIADTGWSDACVVRFTIPAGITRQAPISISPSGIHTICAGDSITLDAGPGWDHYWWRLGSTTLPSTSRFCVARDAGTYTTYVSDSLGRDALSDTVIIRHLPAYHPGITMTGEFEICPGDTVLLMATPDSSAYRWNTGDSTRGIVVTRGGNYWVHVLGPDGCWGRSAVYGIEERNPPPVPHITRNQDSLQTVDALTWQWYLDGQILPGGVGRSILANSPGSYTVSITDTSGCATMSLPFAVTVLDLDVLLPPTPRLRIYPDPSHGDITVTVEAEGSQSVTLAMFNALGQLCWRDTPLHFTDRLTRTVRLPALASGFYTLVARLRAVTLRRMIMLQ